MNSNVAREIILATTIIICTAIALLLLFRVDFSRADSFSPCRMPSGQAVPCEHFLSSNPDQMRIRDEWLQFRIELERKRLRDEKDRQK